MASKPRTTLSLITFCRVNNLLRAIFFQQGNSNLLLKRYRAIFNDKNDSNQFGQLKAEPGKRDVLIFPAIDWEFRFQRPQHMALHLGKRDFRVFYISTVPLIDRAGKSFVIYENPSPGVFLLKLSSRSPRIPNFYTENLTDFEASAFLASLQVFWEKINIISPTIIVQHPFWFPFISRIKGVKIIYDCLDHHAGFKKEVNQKLIDDEYQLVSFANEVITTSAWLAASLGVDKKVHIIRNGCEFERFSMFPRKIISDQPIIGYVGAVSEWFDSDLLYISAKNRPDWQFHIYGACVGANINAAKYLPNVKFFGEIDYSEVPQVVSTFDVCIIPFKLNALTLATNPVKVYEYLAAGRPVVSTALPELDKMESLDVYCSNNEDEFILLIEKALNLANEPERIMLRKNWARGNDWSRRVDNLIALMDE